METTLDGVFVCGNCLQVYDTVDMLSIDAKRAGEHAAEISFGKNDRKSNSKIIPGRGVRYVVPQLVDISGMIPLTFRVERPKENTVLRVHVGKKELFKKKMRWVNPASMIRIEVDIPAEIIASAQSLEVTIDG